MARCDPTGRRDTSDGPCALEFFPVERARTDSSELSIAYQDPTLKIRVPTGVASVSHDTSLGVDASVAGGAMHVSFSGLTSEHADATERYGGDLEDRIFVIDAPILSSGFRKPVDRMSLSLMGVAFASDVELIPWLKDEGRDPSKDERRRMRRRMGEAPSAALTAGGNDERNGGHRARKARGGLSPFSQLNMAQEARVGGHGGGGVGRRHLAAGHPYGEGNGEDLGLGTQGCVDLSKSLIESHTGQVSASKGYTIDLFVVQVHGSFQITPTFDVGVVGGICVDSWKLVLGLHFKLGIFASFNVAATAYWVATGGIKFYGQGLDLQLKPVAIVHVKHRSIRALLGVEAESISASIYRFWQLPQTKYCDRQSIKCAARVGSQSS